MNEFMVEWKWWDANKNNALNCVHVLSSITALTADMNEVKRMSFDSYATNLNHQVDGFFIRFW